MHVNCRRVSVQSSELIALVLFSHNRARVGRLVKRGVKCAIRRCKQREKRLEHDAEVKAGR